MSSSEMQIKINTQGIRRIFNANLHNNITLNYNYKMLARNSIISGVI